jgi:aldehyde dehydrogenase (NAD+)
MTETLPSVAALAQAPFLDGTPKRLLVGGEWQAAASGKVFDCVNPSTGRVIAQLAEGDAADIDRAVTAARSAFEGPWRRFTPAQRQDVLLRFADLMERHFHELKVLDSLDMGSPYGRAASPAPFVDLLRYYAGWPTKLHGETVPNSSADPMFTYTLREPVGVVGAIIPWNGPVTAALWKIGPVLATGCTIVLKPSEEASLSSVRLAELVQEELDLPPGVINVVTGFGPTAGAALSAHHGVDKVAFTGSTATGQAIVRAAAGNLKRVTLELGGKSPDIVFADADLDAAVPGAGMGVFGNSGQVCCAGTRLFVERGVHDEFVERLSDFAGSLTVGDSFDPATQIGPLVSQRQLERVTGYLDAGVRDGARATAGGARLTDGPLADGYFVAPTVFADVRDEMQIAREEIFGPVVSVMPFDDIEEVVARANRTDFGLGAGVWTKDVGRAHRIAHAVSSGVVWVNTYGRFDPAMPFGGMKMSGWGKELSGHSLDSYLNVKAVWVKL